MNCPTCGKRLWRVTRDEDSMLNDEQFDAVRAGDWYCDSCPSNNRARTRYRYFWNHELQMFEQAAAREGSEG